MRHHLAILMTAAGLLSAQPGLAAPKPVAHAAPKLAPGWGPWGGMAGSEWAAEDGSAVYVYRWKIPGEILLVEVTLASAKRTTTIALDETGEGLTLTAYASDGSPVANWRLTNPRPGVSVQDDGRHQEHVVYRFTPDEIVVDQSALKDGVWQPAYHETRHRLARGDAAKIIAALTTKPAARPTQPATPVAIPPQPAVWGNYLNFVNRTWVHTDRALTETHSYRWKTPGVVLLDEWSVVGFDGSNSHDVAEISFDPDKHLIGGMQMGPDGGLVTPPYAVEGRMARIYTRSIGPDQWERLIQQQAKNGDWRTMMMGRTVFQRVLTSGEQQAADQARQEHDARVQGFLNGAVNALGVIGQAATDPNYNPMGGAYTSGGGPDLTPSTPQMWGGQAGGGGASSGLTIASPPPPSPQASPSQNTYPQQLLPDPNTKGKKIEHDNCGLPPNDPLYKPQGWHGSACPA
ncbi:hypothetical protein [Phenylobacterium aquaticum]|uniref:hypothetical protein n=1 Tax=Phenylobacterium aquaticum TaxID=1763816 RepID=UPI0026F09803|nr:hypothetical protein [Phenylobacterium aquaticum]